MKEGWRGDHYFILFEGSELAEKQTAYKIDARLPGFQVLGFLGWDDFLVQDASGKVYTVPTVPLTAAALAEWLGVIDQGALNPDDRFRTKIKWYKQPLIFGGDPTHGENMVWVPHDAHVDLVNYWNDVHSRVSSPQMP